MQRKVLRTKILKFPHTKAKITFRAYQQVLCINKFKLTPNTADNHSNTLDKSVSQVSKTMTSARLFKSKIHTCSTSKQLFFICVYKKIFSPTKCHDNSSTEKFTFVFILGLWMIILLLCLIFSRRVSSLIP